MSSLTFEEDGHIYRWNERVVPSVTQILDPLNDWSRVPIEILERARRRGTAVHKACELWDLGELNLARLSPALLPYLTAWRAFRDETGYVPEATEARLYHGKLGYGGCIDSVGMHRKNLAIIDRKTGAGFPPSAGPQCAAYQRLWNENTGGRKARTRYAVLLKPDGRYEEHPYSDPADWEVFRNLLQIREWKATHP